MCVSAETSATIWSAADLLERFGPIPLDRVRTDPPPGTATEQDVIEIRDREDRLCELIGGALLEKTAGSYCVTAALAHRAAAVPAGRLRWR
ncbi:MAG: hypothetical protein ABSG86_28035 [Thermoguttaceae bacterium]|jgi:hypothetical protein